MASPTNITFHAVFITLSLLPSLATAAESGPEPKPFPKFEVQEIDKTLKVGYGLKIVDLNKDGKLDIVVADAARVIWFDNAANWKLHTIIENAKAGVKADNVCLDVFDIDGDGQLDIALGADWQPNNTKTGGSLQWLKQGDDIDTPWTVHKIAESIPTLHRIRFTNIGADEKPELLVGPLKGRNDGAAELVAYSIPKDPAGEWAAPRVIVDLLHSMHNFTPTEITGVPMIFTASAEGMGALVPEAGKHKWVHIGAGNQDDPKGARGSSEVKSGTKGGMPAYIAAIEPMHGHQLVMYQFGSRRDTEPEPKGPTGIRTVIDDQLKAGHALWCADLDGDGFDEIVAGFRDPAAKGIGPGINIYRASVEEKPFKWQKHILDDKGIACEDLACADLDGDGKIDIVACGRATGNVRIYWNKGDVAKN